MYGYYYRPRIYPYSHPYHPSGGHVQVPHYWQWQNPGFYAGHGAVNYPPPAPLPSYANNQVIHKKYVPQKNQEELIKEEQLVTPAKVKPNPVKNSWYNYGNAITEGTGSFPDYYNTNY